MENTERIRVWALTISQFITFILFKKLNRIKSRVKKKKKHETTLGGLKIVSSSTFDYSSIHMLSSGALIC